MIVLGLKQVAMREKCNKDYVEVITAKTRE